MKKFILPALMLVFWSFNSCQKSDDMSIPNDETSLTVPGDGLLGDDAVVDRSNCQHSITIPAGSVDALADALDNICTGGTIWLATGMHTENSGVVIHKRVKIKGQNNAVLKLHAGLSPNVSDPIGVGLHFKSATKARLENLTIEPTEKIGGTAVLLENSNGAEIKNCHFNDFQMTVVVQKSAGIEIEENTIVASDAWLTGEIPVAHAIVVVNGTNAEIKNNDISKALFGVWACDREGEMEGNYTHDNYIGIIACKVPPNGLTLPSGESVGAKFSCTHWEFKNNKSVNNFDAGIMAIDGATKNKFINNEVGNNGTYDYDLVGDSYRFGFFTPTSFKNTVWVGEYQNATVKNCGEDNVVYGGVLIDNDAFPCF